MMLVVVASLVVVIPSITEYNQQMKSFNLPETISHIQLSSKPERKQTATQDHSATTNKSHCVCRSIHQRHRHLGINSCKSTPTGFFCEGPSNVYPIYAPCHWHIGLLTVCLNHSYRNLQASANQTPVHSAFCWSWPKFQHVDQSLVRNPWTNFQNDWPPNCWPCPNVRSEGLELEWNVVRIFSNTFQDHLVVGNCSFLLKHISGLVHCGSKKPIISMVLYHIDHLVVTFKPYFKPNMLAKFNHLPKIEMNEHEETHDPATWFLTSSISDGDFCMALIWQNNPGSLSLSLSTTLGVYMILQVKKYLHVNLLKDFLLMLSWQQVKVLTKTLSSPADGGRYFPFPISPLPQNKKMEMSHHLGDVRLPYCLLMVA